MSSMCEDVHRPRPVVDPSLTPEHREEVLSAHYRSLRPDPRPSRLREGAAQLFGIGFTLTLTTALGGWYLSMVIATITAVAYTVALLVRGEANPVVRVSGAFLGAGTLAAVPIWVLDPTAATGLPWLVFAGLAAMVAADGLTSRKRSEGRAETRAEAGAHTRGQSRAQPRTDVPADLGAHTRPCAPTCAHTHEAPGHTSAQPSDHFLDFSDYSSVPPACRSSHPSRPSHHFDVHLDEYLVAPDDVNEADHPLLLDVQHTIDRVAEHAHELGEGTDPARTLAVLHEEEWRIAGLLARQRTLRRAHLRRWQRAESDRVREALRPQREYLEAVEDAVRRRVDSIREYGRVFDRALAAHREWVQCEEARESTPDYLRHLADAEALDAGAGEVSELVCAADAAGRVRDEHVRELLGHPIHPDLGHPDPALPSHPGDSDGGPGPQVSDP